MIDTKQPMSGPARPGENTVNEVPAVAQLSIVIPVRNGGKTLDQQLEALARCAKPAIAYEIVVSDNGSTDDTIAVALTHRHHLPVRVVDASRAKGINVARNCGIASSTGRWILLCDADDQIDVEWLVQMVDAFGAGHSLVGGPIDYRALNTDQVCAWRGANRAIPMLVQGFLRTPHGANCGFTRQVYDAIGGFDESFVWGGDDVDFFWRAQLAGQQLHTVPEAVVHYRLRSTFSELWAQSVSYGDSEALLHRKFAEYGHRRRSAGRVLYDIWWLATRLPFVVSHGRRGAWLRVLGQEWGRVRGTIRHRTLWL